MIITEFLSTLEYAQYGDWLKKQDGDTLRMYFGVASNHSMIDVLVKQVVANTSKHYFLVAKHKDQWVGVIHIAAVDTTVEFGVIVDAAHRNQGIANTMLDEAITWSRNRGYRELYMHCLGWNQPIKHLCNKHGLATKTVMGDSDVELKLPPANWSTLNKEFGIKQRNLFHMFLQNNHMLFDEIYG